MIVHLQQQRRKDINFPALFTRTRVAKKGKQLILLQT